MMDWEKQTDGVRWGQSCNKNKKHIDAAKIVSAAKTQSALKEPTSLS